MNKLMLVLTVLGLCFLSLVYGTVSVYMRWWPSELIAGAKNSATALLSVREEEFERNWPTSMEAFDDEGRQSLTTINHVPVAELGNDLIFVDGGSQQLRSHCPENGCIAWLMERDGTVRHVWDIGPDLIWEDLQNVDGFSGAENIYSVGAHPFPNGDLLVTYQGRNTYPYAVGMAKFDKDSKLLWKKENFAHHWFTVDADGYIYVPAFSELEAPHLLDGNNLQINCKGGILQEDVILVLNPDGEEVDRISVLQALADSDYLGVAYQAIHSDTGLPLNWDECDPTHLNDVRVIWAADAATSRHLSAGDLLVSLRSNNAILTINRETKKVGWLSVGRTILQHSPRYMGDNTILLFDNLGGQQAQGGTRIVRLNMDTDAVDVVYPPPGDASITNMISYTGGYIGLNRDKTRALVSLTRQGRSLEIDLATGRLLWEFLNSHDVSDVVADEAGRSGARFAAQTVRYFNQADFEFNEGRP